MFMYLFCVCVGGAGVGSGLSQETNRTCDQHKIRLNVFSTGVSIASIEGAEERTPKKQAKME